MTTPFMIQMLHEYRLFGALLLLGGILGAVPLILPLLIAPRSHGRKTHDTYECGMDTIGSAWIRFSILFYLFALIFVAFEVDVLYLIPVALMYGVQIPGQSQWLDLVSMSVFLGILSLAIIFAARKGVFSYWK